MERTSTHSEPQSRRDDPRVIGIHSSRGGSGRTTVAANLAFLAARAGARVAAVDADLQAPALHERFGFSSDRILHSVSEFVRGQCDLRDVPIDLTLALEIDEPGKLYLLPASPEIQTIASILFEGYDVSRLNEELRKLARDLELDLLIIDTHLGINRETLLSLATSETVLVLLRPDGQDRAGAAVLVDLAKKVGAPACWLVPNMISASESEGLRAKLEKEFETPVAGVLPRSEDFESCACEGLFVVRQPDHAFTTELVSVSERLLSAPVNGELASTPANGGAA